MTSRTVVIIVALVVCFGSVWAVLAQRQQLALLRAQQRPPSVRSTDISEDPMVVSQTNSPGAASSIDSSSEELLRLRSDVTQLSARKRGLAGVVEENERLRKQLENSQTNAPGERQLPAGYLRKSEAKFVGYGTPENTFQSFLWALRNHETNSLLQSLTPNAAQKLQARFEDPNQAAEFFKNIDAMPGLAPQNRKDQLDGSAQFEVEVIPGLPKETMSLQLIGGEWKLDLPF